MFLIPIFYLLPDGCMYLWMRIYLYIYTHINVYIYIAVGEFRKFRSSRLGL